MLERKKMIGIIEKKAGTGWDFLPFFSFLFLLQWPHTDLDMKRPRHRAAILQQCSEGQATWHNQLTWSSKQTCSIRPSMIKND
jgi:hypothetical protein